MDTPQTKTSTMHRTVALVAMLLIGVAVAFAASVETGYRTIRGHTLPASVAAQTSATAAQSTDWTATPINPIASNGNPRVLVEGTFQTSGATCVVTVGRYAALATDPVTYQFLGLETQTLTASTTERDGGLGSAHRYQAAAPKTFDLYAAPYYDLRMAAPSSGSATLVHYPYGSAARDHEND